MVSCPKCTADIPEFRIGGRFRCPTCQTLLSSNYATLVPIVIGIALLAEAGVFFTVFSSAGFDGALLLFAFVGGLTAAAVYWFLVKFWVSVRVVPKQEHNAT